MTPSTPRAPRQNNFDFLRFWLAVLVIFSHAFALPAGSDKAEPLYRLSGGQLSWGGFAVDAFFVISGYLITASWLHSKGLGDFLWKRALRIYPGFIAAVAFGVLVVSPLAMGRFARPDFPAWLLGTANLRGYSPPGVFADLPVRALNGSLWSVSYECWCYVGVAALGLTALLPRRRAVLALLLAAIAVSVVFVVKDLKPGGKWLGVLFGYPPFWARLLPYYLAGMTFYLWRDRIPSSKALALLALLLMAAAVLVPPWGVAAVFPIAATYLLLYVAFLPRTGVAGWARYGDFSYGMYLYAFPLQQLLLHWRPGLGPWALFALATPLTLVLAAVSWHAVESPCLRLKRRRPAISPTPVAPTAEELPATAAAIPAPAPVLAAPASP
jgi:peptidoglycan/LPS O-acetylase OafA/YrhL